MIDMINAIDHGGNELDVLGVYDSYRLERQVNSYRAMQIAQYFGVNVSKGKLTRFSKPKDHQYDFTASQLLEYISEHYDAFINYWEWFKQPAVLEAKRNTQLTNNRKIEHSLILMNPYFLFFESFLSLPLNQVCPLNYPPTAYVHISSRGNSA